MYRASSYDLSLKTKTPFCFVSKFNLIERHRAVRMDYLIRNCVGTCHCMLKTANQLI
jgi:hypothetical protein